MHFYRTLLFHPPVWVCKALCACLAALVVPLSLRAEEVYFTISGQDYAAVPDSAAMTLYCSVPASALPAQVGIRSSAGTIYEWDEGADGHSITLRDCTRTYPLRSVRDGAVWQVAFTTLPVVTLTTTAGPLTGHDEMPAQIQVFDPQRNPGRSYRYDCQANYRGSYSILFEKKSLSIDLVDKLTGKEVETSFCGIRSTNAWILDAMAVDPMRMRNRLCFDLWNTVSACPWNGQRNGTEGQYVELIYEGRYHGLYCLTDKVKRKTLGLRKTPDGAPDGLHGLLYKGLSGQWCWALCLQWYDAEPMDSVVWNRYELRYPNNTVGEAVWNPLLQTILTASQINDDNTQENFEAHWRERFYEDNFYDYALLLMVMNLIDNGMYNSYLATYDYEADPRMLMIPWDMDGSLGRNPNGYKETRNRGWGQVDYLGPYGRMLTYRPQEFSTELNQRWMRWKEGAFSPEAFGRRLRAYADLLLHSGAWGREYARWQEMMTGSLLDFSPTPHEEADYICQWYREQVHYIDSLLQKGITGIGSATTYPASSSAAAVYNLRGQYLGRYADVWNGLPQGIYVVGGQKRVKARR